MGSKRMGLARMEALIENLKREIDFGAGTILRGLRHKAETLSSVGTHAAPTKTLTAVDSGMHFFVDIGTVSVVAQLPAVAAGLTYKFILATASDNEATQDFVVSTGDDDVDINGSVLVNGAHVEVTSSTSAVIIDTSDGAATVGDWLEFTCDGTDWYVTGSVLSASALNITNAADGHTVP